MWKHNKTCNATTNSIIKPNIDISEIGDIKKVSIYQSLIKDENGDAQIHDLTAIQFSPSWEEGPKWPVVQQGPQIQLQKTTTKPKEASGFKTCVVVPDIQFGFYRNFDGTLEPTHDEKCISILISFILI